jgi:hypothetical protein
VLPRSRCPRRMTARQGSCAMIGKLHTRGIAKTIQKFSL